MLRALAQCVIVGRARLAIGGGGGGGGAYVHTNTHILYV